MRVSGRAVGVCALVRLCGCVWACGCARGQCVAACPSPTPSFVRDCGYQLMGFLSPQDLGVYVDNPPSTPASPPLLSSSPPSLRAYQSPELQLLSESHIQMSFPIGPHLFPIHLLSFPLHPCFDLTGPSLLSSQPFVPLFLSCTCLAKSQPCLNLFPCLSL